MYSLVNSIIKLINKYTSFSTLYVEEFKNDMSFFEFFNGLILFTILILIFIRFLIKKYTFKTILFFILKRLFIASFLFFFIYLLSDFTLCETPINKGIKKGIKDLIDTENKKYVCIAIAAVTGCYLAYKYVPGWYTDLKSYSKYKDYLFKKNEYSLNYKLYLEFLEKQKDLKIYQVENLNYFNFQATKFNSKILNYILNYTKLQADINILKSNVEIQQANILLILKYSPFRLKDELNEKINKLIFNYEKSFMIINDLKTSKKIYEIEFEEIEIIHSMVGLNVVALIDFYPLYIFNEINNIERISFLLKDDHLLRQLTIDNMCHNLKLLEALIDNALYSSNQLLIGVESISTFPLLSDCLKINYTIKDVQKPVELKINIVDYPPINLEGLKFLSINFGYICFYPLLYCSNKILGTVNPLSSKVFKEAILYFFPFSGFF